MFEVESCMHSFHIYEVLWTLQVGEILSCIHESDNGEDSFAVSCTVTGNRRSTDLPQGGCEVPCRLKFEGPDEIVEEVRKDSRRLKENKPLAI